MEWLLENFGKLLPIVLMVLYFLLNKGRKSEDDEVQGAEPEGVDQDERVRRIQDEIRRRILERQRGESPQPAVEPPVLVEERPLHGSETGDFHKQEAGPAPVHRPDWQEQEEASRLVLERQAKLAERLAQARRQAASTSPVMAGDIQSANPILSSPLTSRSPSTMGRVAIRTGGVINPLRRTLLSDLAGPNGLRRAVLLREVLGEPVGMRRESTFQR
jgi:hypothetical protein